MIKVFKKDNKVNFVDHENVLVGFDCNEQCCENFGYFIALNEYKERIVGLRENEKDFDLTDYEFDQCFFKYFESEDKEGMDAARMAIFRMRTGFCIDPERELFLHLYNFHNGFYTHDFRMTREGGCHTSCRGYL